MAETTLTIEGMSCGHCVMRAKKAIDALEGVTKSDVKVGAATVEFDEAKVGKSEIAAAVEKAGYKTSAQ
jgi:copper chaperone